MNTENTVNSVELAAELTIAWLSNPNTRAEANEVKAFLQEMKTEIERIESPATDVAAEVEPQRSEGAVSVRKSLASKDHIISMIDGKPYKTLRRHLSTHGMTPEEYRERYGLKRDYPMVAPAYSEHRRDMARMIGLGRKRSVEQEAAPAPVEAKTKRTRGKGTTSASA